MKKVGVLTLPLFNNYGGLLQAYALQTFLVKNGFEVETVDFSLKGYSTANRVKRILKNMIRKYILREDVTDILAYSLTKVEVERVNKYMFSFKNEHIKTTHQIKGFDKLSELDTYSFDAYVVGSDQVWRPTYSPRVTAYFFDFVSDQSEIRRLSYAASFGVDHIDDFSEHELEKCKALINRFDGISVREDSGVDLCKKHFGVTAKHVVDPTMLLSVEDYKNLIIQDEIKNGVTEIESGLTIYVLDQSQDKKLIVEKIAAELCLKVNNIMPESKNDVYPPVSHWLKSFMNAEFVITDSFHGTVFSILFNKPFIAVGNEGRGLSRFLSLLTMFGLEERLVYSSAQITNELINKKIDYVKVNNLLEYNILSSSDFILNSIDVDPT